MHFTLQPVSLKISKEKGFGISIFGYEYRSFSYGLGIYYNKNLFIDRIEHNIVFSLYSRIYTKTVKVIPISHYVCKECNTPVNHNTFYCNTCRCELIQCEVNWIE